MTISKEDFKKLCCACEMLNEEEINAYLVWHTLNNIIKNIKEEK